MLETFTRSKKSNEISKLEIEESEIEVQQDSPMKYQNEKPKNYIWEGDSGIEVQQDI